MATKEAPRDEWTRATAAGVLAALVPVLVMSASHGWLSWSIAVSGVLLILTTIGALAIVQAGR